MVKEKASVTNIHIGPDNIDEVIRKIVRGNDDPKFLIIDLFCGFGGTTTGVELAEVLGKQVAKVIACVNHDPKAIKSHWLNHPHVIHFEEDIRTLNLGPLQKLVEHYRKLYPNAVIVLWASLECTNFSKAKGGQSRDADSRTLADHLDRYILAINPDYVQIENVVEFKEWGPMIPKVINYINAECLEVDIEEYKCCPLIIDKKNGTVGPWMIPDPERKSEYWRVWCKRMCGYGYRDEWKELNSANFGAYTSRNRLFGIFSKDGMPIVWPPYTHSKQKNVTSALSLFTQSLQPWKAVKDVLDFSDEGLSIFNRAKPLSDKTFERILAGLIKYVANGDKAFISKYFSGKPKGKVNSVDSPASTVTTFGNQSLIQAVGFTAKGLEEPAGTITTVDHHALVQAAFIQQRNSGNPDSKVVGVDGPARTLTATGGNQDLVQPKFLSCYYGNGDNNSSVNSPCPTLVTKDRIAIIQPQYFIEKNLSAQNQSIEQPAGVVMPNDKHRLVEAVPFLMPTNFDNQPKSIEDPAPVITANRKHHYLINPSHGGWSTSTNQPCPVIIARQDKAPLYLVQAVEGKFLIPVYDCDTPVVIEIKRFMAIYRIVDIKMRMLRVHELLRIQGFPVEYKMVGNQTDHKKFIGNSVHPLVPKAWYESLYLELNRADQKVA